MKLSDIRRFSLFFHNFTERSNEQAEIYPVHFLVAFLFLKNSFAIYVEKQFCVHDLFRITPTNAGNFD